MSKLLISIMIVSIFGLVSCGGAGDEGSTDRKEEEVAETMTDGAGEGAVVMTISGKEITEKDLGQAVDMLKTQLQSRMSPQQMMSMGGMLRKQAAQNVINRELLEQAVEKEDIDVTEEEIASRIADIRQNFGSEEAFVNQLTSLGMSQDDFRAEIVTGLSIEALIEKHTKDHKMADEAEVKDFYEENADQFKRPERVRASHILISVSKEDTEEQKAEKWKKASSLLSDIKQGVDFAQLAAANSDCPSRSSGGDLNFFGRGQMVKPFEDAAFALKVGEVSDIVETQFGYHIIKVTEREDARTVPLEEAREDIASYLDNNYKQEAVNTYIEGLRTAAVIEYADSSLIQ